MTDETTMTDEDDLLAAYDLSAWHAPDPATGLADAVIARARSPVAASAVDTSERPTTRRWWWAAAAATVAAAAVLIAMWGVRRAPADGHGVVVATSHGALSIGETTATVDAGTELRWERKQHVITVVHTRGRATWRVASDDTLRIDAGAMGALVEATGASLRVEVDMNRTDVRAIGVSAATAIVVAALTVVVYEGHVSVSRGGQTVNVVPGTTYEIASESPKEAFAVGGGDPRIATLEAENAALRAQLAQADAPPDTLDELEIAGVMGPLKSRIRSCNVAYEGTLEFTLKVGSTGEVLETAVSGAPRPPTALVTCARAYAAAVRFPATSDGIDVNRAFAVALTVRPTGATDKTVETTAKPACDVEALRQKGEDHLQTGMDAAALAAFEAAIKCNGKPSAVLTERAYMAACRSRNATRGKFWFKLIAKSRQPAMAQMCSRNGIAVQ